jgi:hypothetical protein
MRKKATVRFAMRKRISVYSVGFFSSRSVISLILGIFLYNTLTLYRKMGLTQEKIHRLRKLTALE